MTLSRLLLFLVVLAVLLGVAGYVLPEKSTTPRFSDYSISEQFSGEPAAVDFDTNPDALQFKTRIQNAAASGPNFAGKYAVAEWGCGTNCAVAAVVDAETGAVVEYGLVSEFGFSYKKDSRLFIVNPPEAVPEELKNVEAFFDTATVYLEMNGGNFRQVAKQPVLRTR